MLFVKMLTIILQRISRSIQTKEACLPVITTTSPVTSDPNVHSSKPRIQRFKRKLPTRATSSTLPPTALQAPQHQQQFVPAYQIGKSKKNKSRCYKRKPQKPTSNHGYERLLSLMQGMLRSMTNKDMTRKPSPRVKQLWVKNDETIHPLRESELT
jgi:hypothetical protein